METNKKTKLPISNTALLLTITICSFFAMYLLGMVVWGGGFLNFQQFLNIFNNNAYLIIIACGLTIVMISGGIDISVGGQITLITMASVVILQKPGGSSSFSRNWSCLWSCSGIPCCLPQDSAVYHYPCRYVPCKRYYNNHPRYTIEG